VQIKRIFANKWYQTKKGIGKCLSVGPGAQFKFAIEGKSCWLSCSEVQHEIAKGEEPKPDELADLMTDDDGPIEEEPDAPKKRITIQVDADTYQWLKRLENDLQHVHFPGEKVTMQALLQQAAFCFADHAGRRTGSWEADVGGRLLQSSGYEFKQ
jgi:hypothetical protein